MQLLAFDYGLKNIGVAVGHTLTGTATALPLLKARDGVPQWEREEEILQEGQPELVLVGRPRNRDDSERELSARARKFANRLRGRFGVAVEMVDERLTSCEAKGEVMARGGSRHYGKHPVDSVAARLIIETYLNSR